MADAKPWQLDWGSEPAAAPPPVPAPTAAPAPKPWTMDFGQPPEAPEPSFGEVAEHAFRRALSGSAQSARAVGQGAPGEELEPQTAFDQEPITFEGVFTKPLRTLKHVVGQTVEASPTLGGGILGAAALSETGPGGALVGGAGGMALGNLVQTLGPNYAAALKKYPGDPEAAYREAVRVTSIGTGGTFVSGLLLGANPFSGKIKSLLIQTFGTQPAAMTATAMGEQLARGETPTVKGAVEAYPGQVVGGLGAVGVGEVAHAVGSRHAPAARGAEPLADMAGEVSHDPLRSVNPAVRPWDAETPQPSGENAPALLTPEAEAIIAGYEKEAANEKHSEAARARFGARATELRSRFEDDATALVPRPQEGAQETPSGDSVLDRPALPAPEPRLALPAPGVKPWDHDWDVPATARPVETQPPAGETPNHLPGVPQTSAHPPIGTRPEDRAGIQAETPSPHDAPPAVEPLRVYHGTNAAPFEAFDMTRAGSGAWRNAGLAADIVGRGDRAAIYATTESEHAGRYGRNVIALDAQFENPLHFDAKRYLAGWLDLHPDIKTPQNLVDQLHQGDVYRSIDADNLFNRLIGQAKAEGHDAVIVDFADLRGAGARGGPLGKVVIALKPEQLRRAPETKPDTAAPAKKPKTEADYQRRYRPVRLAAYLKGKGGLREARGELAHMGANRVRGLVRSQGMHPDEAARMAQEAGFLPRRYDRNGDLERVDMNDLFEALYDDLGGRAIYSEDDAQRLEQIKGNAKAAKARAGKRVQEAFYGEATGDPGEEPPFHMQRGAHGADDLAPYDAAHFIEHAGGDRQQAIAAVRERIAAAPGREEGKPSQYRLKLEWTLAELEDPSRIHVTEREPRGSANILVPQGLRAFPVMRGNREIGVITGFPQGDNFRVHNVVMHRGTPPLSPAESLLVSRYIKARIGKGFETVTGLRTSGARAANPQETQVRLRPKAREEVKPPVVEKPAEKPPEPLDDDADDDGGIWNTAPPPRRRTNLMGGAALRSFGISDADLERAFGNAGSREGVRGKGKYKDDLRTVPLTPAERTTYDKVITAATDELKRLAPKLPLDSVTPAKRINVRVEGDRWGGAEGVYGRDHGVNGVKHLMQFALEISEGLPRHGADVVRTVRHEAIHYLFQNGYFTAKEWRGLMQEAERGQWLKKLGMEKDYAHLPIEHRLEEAIAEQLSRAAKAKAFTAFPAPLRPVMAKLYSLFRKVYRAIKSAVGDTMNSHDLFDLIERGEIGARTPKASDIPWRQRGVSRQAKHDERPGDLVGSMGSGKPFFSQVEHWLERLPMKKASGAQWLGTLKQRPGVKAEELETTGLAAWLTENKDRAITKDEVQAHLDDNAVRLEETTLGGTENQLNKATGRVNHAHSALLSEIRRAGHTDPDSQLRNERGLGFVKFIEDLRNRFGGKPNVIEALNEYRDATIELNRVRAASHEGEEGGTKFSDWTEPGGTNYREHLLRLPDKAQQKWSITENSDGEFDVLDHTGRVRYTGAERADAQQYLNEEQQLAPTREGRAFRSSHFNEDNILAHFRTKDRIGPNGEKILHVEEIQSDWHQKGRAGGYRRPESETAPLRAELAQLNSRDNELFRQMSLDTGPRGGRAGTAINDHPSNAERDQIGRRTREIVATLKASDEGPPDAPFKNTWHELALKRILDMAAREGYDEVAWTPGKMQAERYGLEKHVDRIKIVEMNSGPKATYSLEAFKKYDGDANEPVAVEHNLTLEQLRDQVGTEVAERALAKIEEGKKKPVPYYAADLRGDDLKIGAAGFHRTLYDQKVPQFFNAFGKRFGVRVADTEFEAAPKEKDVSGYSIKSNGTDFWLQRHDHFAGPNDAGTRVHGTFKNYLEADDARTAIRRRAAAGLVQFPSFKITPAMREALAQGQPLH